MEDYKNWQLRCLHRTGQRWSGRWWMDMTLHWVPNTKRTPTMETITDGDNIFVEYLKPFSWCFLPLVGMCHACKILGLGSNHGSLELPNYHYWPCGFCFFMVCFLGKQNQGKNCEVGMGSMSLPFFTKFLEFSFKCKRQIWSPCIHFRI